MTSLTLRNIPDALMERLRSLAEEEQRSLNEQVLFLLDEVTTEHRPGFADAFDAFVRENGPSPLDDDDLADLRSTEHGRSVQV